MFFRIFLPFCLAISAAADDRFTDSFDRAEVGESWQTHKDAFTIRDGFLVVQQQPGTNHGAVCKTKIDFKDAEIRFKFRFAGSPYFNFVIDDKNYKGSHAGHICRVRFFPDRIVLGDDKTGIMENEIFKLRQGTPEERKSTEARIKSTIATIKTAIAADVWHDVGIVISGNKLSVDLNGRPMGELTSPGIGHETKTQFGYTVADGELHLDDIKLTSVAEVSEQQAGVWPIDRLKSEVPKFRIEDETEKIQSLIYEGEKIDGEPTEVFAFYASPKTIGISDGDEKFPGIVLIHGGGGTAFADWVWLWANQGYAAIAMDLGGRRPPVPEFDSGGNLKPHTVHKREARVRLDKAGVADGHGEKFDSIGGGIEDDWPFHAVANVMRAHTLLRSFPDVEAEKTAVTGISWGGYTTCLVASNDDRFKAAVPVYGCGFLHEGESVQKPSIDKLGDRRDTWVAAYDPGSHLQKCVIPTLWVNSTHDVHYVLDSYARSYTKVQGPRTMRIEPRMRHGHQPGWAPKEIQIFVDSVLQGGTPLATVGEMTVDDAGTVSVSFESKTKVVKAELHFTTEDGLRSKRKWHTLGAEILDGKVAAEGLPADANTWIMTLTDEREAMVSTEVSFR